MNEPLGTVVGNADFRESMLTFDGREREFNKLLLNSPMASAAWQASSLIHIGEYERMKHLAIVLGWALSQTQNNLVKLAEDKTTVFPIAEVHADFVHLLEKEKQRRAYYQNIVYQVCNIIDQERGDGKRTVCGTVDTPSTEVQDTLKALFAGMEPKF